jgi:hypothetical protein
MGRREQLVQALREAYPRAKLDSLISLRLERGRLDDYALGDDYRDIVFRLLMAAEQEGWTDELVAAAHASNPGNAKLARVAADFGLGADAPVGEAFEVMVVKANVLLDPDDWWARFGEIQVCVCHIEIPAGPRTYTGTGFLVGPQAVITNYHVVEPMIEREGKPAAAQPADVRVRFDYKRLRGKLGSSEGTVCGLADEWLIDSSPYSEVDKKADPGGEVPSTGELDYALLRLDTPIGDRPVGRGDDGDWVKRGWIELAPNEAPEKDAGLIIVQHPDGQPIKFAWDDMLGTNGNKTRLRYQTNTMPGSSGSPCFDVGWRLVGLHHMGDNNYDEFHAPQWNQGVTMTAIAAQVSGNGVQAAIAAGA